MKNKLEHILLSLLLGTSILLGLAFWLNTFFGFNLFFKEHWEELAKLQASHTPINSGFYISIGFAIFLFVFGLFVIYVPKIKRVQKPTEPERPKTQPAPTPVPEQIDNIPLVQQTGAPTTRPPRLNIPLNMAQIAKQQYSNRTSENTNTQNQNGSVDLYNPMLSKIFTDNNYVVKTNPVIAGLPLNLFAIGPQETLWMGAVDKDISKMHAAMEKLDSVFQETLEDIEININAFVIDTLNQYQSDDSVLIFKSIDELKSYIDSHKAATLTDDESFVAYSEYIDTIIQYIKNL